MLRDLAPNSQFDPMPEDYLTSIVRASVRGAGDLALAVGPSVAIMAEGVVAAHSRVVSESVWGDRTVLSIPRGEVALDDECPSSSGCPSCDPADDRRTPALESSAGRLYSNASSVSESKTCMLSMFKTISSSCPTVASLRGSTRATKSLPSTTR